MLIVVDGYNFMFTVPELERYVGENRIESVRSYIISLFSKYREKKHYDITVVFDGCTETVLPKKQIYAGISIIYSKSGINADTEIKIITDQCQNPGDVCVVTYDKDIRRHVKKCGCQIIEPKAMYKEISGVLNNDKKKKSDEPEYKQKGPSENDARYWKDIFKDIPDEEIKPAKYNIKKTDTAKEKKKTRKLPHNSGEPFCKYQGTSSDEIQYWLGIFRGVENNDRQD